MTDKIETTTTEPDELLSSLFMLIAESEISRDARGAAPFLGCNPGAFDILHHTLEYILTDLKCNPNQMGRYLGGVIRQFCGDQKAFLTDVEFLEQDQPEYAHGVERTTVPCTKELSGFVHCGRCGKERPPTESPES